MVKDARTEKLYLADPYTAHFQATVLSCEKVESGRFAAVLDRTCFYPESGGQPSDRGTLSGVEVVDVQEADDGAVRHVLSGPVALGPAEGRVDWDRRFDHMQQHTGQHILSRAFIKAGGLATVSFHLGEEICTIDLDGPRLDDTTLDNAERLANSIIWEDRPVTIRTGAREELGDGALRKAPPEGIAELRLVEVEGFDTVGCCGTHVRHAGEIGVIKVLKHEKTKGVFRVHFLAGKRAYRDLSKKHDIVKNLANQFTTSADTLEERIEKLQAENQQLRKESQKLSRRIVVYEGDRMHEGAVRHRERSYVVEVLGDAGEEFLRLLGSHLKGKKGTVSVLANKEGAVVCNASDDVAIDLPAVVVERAKALGGSGGGKGGYAAARLPASVAPADFLRDILEDLKRA